MALCRVVVALLIAGSAAQAQTLSQIWYTAPGTGNLDTSSASQRTLSYNPVSGNVIYTSRAGGSLTVNRITGLAGAVVSPTMNTNDVYQGTFALNATGVSDDGVVYGCNLQSPLGPNSPLKVYRWSSESAVPTLAFFGDVNAGAGGRWGDAMAVRGSGPTTQILISSDQNAVAYLKTADGTNFNGTKLTITGGSALYQTALAFGPPGVNVFWGRKSGNSPMYRVGFDPAAGTAQTLGTNSMPLSLVGIAFNPANFLFVGVTRATAATAQTNFLYRVSSDLATFTLLDQKVNPSANGDGGASQTGAAWGNGRAFTEVANNGIVGWAITPFITRQPANTTNAPASRAAFSVVADGTGPLGYQWRKNGTPISGASASTYAFTVGSCTDAGAFSVVVSSQYGSITSAVATLTVPESVVPTITCPADITVNGSGSTGAVVTFTVTATDNCDPAPVVTCSPASGSLFPNGKTTVTCTAKDNSGNSNSCSFTVTVVPPPPTSPNLFFASDVFPPSNGVYLLPAPAVQTYGNGVIIRGLRLRDLRRAAAPVPGMGDYQQFDAVVEFEHSMDGGVKFAPASSPTHLIGLLLPAVQRFPALQGQASSALEIVQMDVNGGTLPAGVMLRESPTEVSMGRTTEQPVPGGYLISSFFDIFLELSVDGGQTWSPAADPAHLELRVNPAGILIALEPVPLLLPPDNAFVGTPETLHRFGQSVVIHSVRQSFFSQSFGLPQGSDPETHQYDSEIDLMLSTDGGQTFRPVRAPATGKMMVKTASIGGTTLVDAELLQLDVNGGGLPTGTVIRESPTRESRGGASLSQLQGNLAVGFFVDINLEVSVDGGQTFLPPVGGPLHVELQNLALPHFFSSSSFPPDKGLFALGPQEDFHFSNGAIIRGLTVEHLAPSQPPPAPGQSQVQSFTADVGLMLSLNGGQTWLDVRALGDGSVRLSSLLVMNPTTYFDTEMLGLNIHGGNLPAGVMLRESPTLPSRGRTTTTTNPVSGQVQMASFFDIYPELSVDGGQSWTRLDAHRAIGLTPLYPFAPFTIQCPSNLVVSTSSASGTVVNYLVTYLFPDCPFGPFTVTCTPPSGSVFPVGNTTVTCVGTDGCGEHPTCSFTVTVNRLYYPLDQFFTLNRLPPSNGLYLSLSSFDLGSSRGTIVRNLRQHTFSRSFLPPPVGAPEVQRYQSVVDLDLSEDGGVTFRQVHAQADESVSITALAFPNGPPTYDTEILELNISGGDLPPGVKIRESPTRRSAGNTAIRAVPGGFFISSFFDLFAELSVDGGQTWAAAADPTHMELRTDPAGILIGLEPQPVLLPPTDALVSSPGRVMFASDIFVDAFRQGFFSDFFTLPSSGDPAVHPFHSQVDLTFSSDGGKTMRIVRAPATGQMKLNSVNPGPPGLGVFDTEMLQLEVSGGELPQGVMLRASPSLPSRGTLLMAMQVNGLFAISSFFDIFPEITVDGGQTWYPAQNGPLHVELQKVAGPHLFGDSSFPSPGSQLLSRPQQPATYLNGVMVRDLMLLNFTSSAPLPSPGASGNAAFSADVQLMLSLNGGQTWSPYSAVADANVFLRSLLDWNASRYFDTEMLSLNIHGGNLPAGILIRESPTKASLGRASSTPDLLGGKFAVESFFDVFTEMSLDGGQSWNPSAGGIVVGGAPRPIGAFTISCPSNITVFATSTNGALVTYLSLPLLYPDCPFGPYTVTCNPPSGTVFPIGVTTVTCIGSDGCNEHPTCSFTVTVLERFRFSGLFNTILGDALAHFVPTGTGAPSSSFLISNVGPSGRDGFHMDLPGAEGLLVNFDPFDLRKLTSMVSVARDTAGDVIGTSRLTAGPIPRLSMDFSPQKFTQMLVQISDGHTVLASSNIASGAVIDINSLFPAGCPNGTSFYSVSWLTNGGWYRFCRAGCDCFGTNCFIERIVCFTGVSPSALARLASVDLLAAAPSNTTATLTVLDEQFLQFGNFHVGRGQVVLSADQRGLTLSNLGTSGDDGISVNLGASPTGPTGAKQFAMTLSPITMGPGSLFSLHAVGDVNGLPGASLGDVSLAGPATAGGGLPVSANFSSVGATLVRVEVFDGSTFVGSATLLNGILGNLLGGPQILRCGVPPGPAPGFWMAFDRPFQFQLNDGSKFFGTELRLLAANTQRTMQTVSTFRFTGGNIGDSVTVGGESTPLGVLTITCPSDITVFATSSNGAPVTFLPLVPLFPDCPFGPYTSTCSPPSGTTFPIGTTVVTCSASDGCGEHPSCTFRVTVLERFHFSGFVNYALGDALVHFTPGGTGPPAPALLVISNLGPSLRDGFHIDAPGADGLLVNFNPFDLRGLTTLVSVATDTSGKVIGTGTLRGGPNPSVSVDFSALNADTVSVQISDGRTTLAASNMFNGGVIDINSLFPSDCPNGTSFYSVAALTNGAWYRFCRAGCNCIGTNCFIERVVCFAVRTPAALAALSSLDLRAATSNGMLAVLNEQFLKLGNFHTGKGQAELGVVDRALRVSNLGSSGGDGVLINIGSSPASSAPVSRLDVGLLPISMGPGSLFALRAAGDVNGAPETSQGRASLAGNAATAGQILVNADFNDVGATLVRVEVFNGNTFAGRTTVPSGLVGRLSGQGRIIGCGNLPAVQSFRVGFDALFQFAGSDGAQFSGNELRLFAGNPTKTTSGIGSFCLQATGLGDYFDIITEIVPPRLSVAPTLSSGNLIISWEGPGHLECTDILGAGQTPWQDVPGTSPLTIQVDRTKNRYYRVVSP